MNFADVGCRFFHHTDSLTLRRIRIKDLRVLCLGHAEIEIAVKLRPEPWKCTTPAPEAEKPAAVCQEVTVEQLKQELPHVFQPAPEKAEKAATAQQPDHYEALEQMLNNKPRAGQPAPKAPAAPRPVVKPVVTAPKKKSLLERIGSFFRR